jgi:probable rRNA maturation factor
MISIEPPSRSFDMSGVSKAGLARFLRAALRAAGLEGEVQVLLADDRTLRRLNRRFLGKNKATDVLSFPAAATAVFFSEPGGAELAGDLAISLEMAARQAARYGHSLRDEVRVLLLHGVLHLAGFDHERDRGEMAEKEAELRGKLGLRSGLIARGGGAEAKGKNAGRKVRAAGVGSPASGSFAPPSMTANTNTGVLRSTQDDKAGRARRGPG